MLYSRTRMATVGVEGLRPGMAVMLSPRGQSGNEAKFRPRHRPQTFGLGLASISLSYYVIEHFSGKNRVKFVKFVNFLLIFPAIILNRMLLIIIWYFLS